MLGIHLSSSDLVPRFWSLAGTVCWRYGTCLTYVQVLESAVPEPDGRGDV